jgi:DNA-binding IclR family transcriptional regulator
MTQDSSIQSLDRGLAILRLIADKRCVTASYVSSKLGIHQSSGSRLLNSLLKAGFVKKPNFHSFSLDYGALEFAGLALNSLPGVQVAYKCCDYISQETKLNVSIGILRDNKILYLTHNDIERGSGLKILSDKQMALHKSSLGCVIAWSLGQKKGLKLLKQSYEFASEKDESQKLLQEVSDSMEKDRLFWFTAQEGVKFNAAVPFDLDGEKAAVAVYSRKRIEKKNKVHAILMDCLNILSEQGEGFAKN